MDDPNTITKHMAKRPRRVTGRDLPDHVEFRIWDEKEVKEDLVSQTHKVQTTEQCLRQQGASIAESARTWLHHRGKQRGQRCPQEQCTKVGAEPNRERT